MLCGAHLVDFLGAKTEADSAVYRVHIPCLGPSLALVEKVSLGTINAVRFFSAEPTSEDLETTKSAIARFASTTCSRRTA